MFSFSRSSERFFGWIPNFKCRFEVPRNPIGLDSANAFFLYGHQGNLTLSSDMQKEKNSKRSSSFIGMNNRQSRREMEQTKKGQKVREMTSNLRNS